MNFGWLLVKTVLALGIILGIIFVLFRYVVPKFQLAQFGSGSRIRVLERFGLSPRQALYLVQVDKKIFLLGSCEQGITKIDEMST